MKISELYEDAYGLPRGILPGLVRAESGGNPNAVGPKTRTGERAVGLAQFMPGTAKELGIDPRNPDQSLEGAARYLSQQMKRFNGDPRLALAAYNAGPGNVQKYGGVPPFKETQGYVERILNALVPAAGAAELPPEEAPAQTMRLSDLGGDPQYYMAPEAFQAPQAPEEPGFLSRLVGRIADDPAGTLRTPLYEVAGGTLGGFLGAPAGPVGMAAGAGLGAAAAHGLVSAYDRLRGNEPRPMGQVMQDAAMAGALDAVGGPVGEAVGGGLRYGGAALARRIAGGHNTPAVREMARDYAELQVPLSVAGVTGSRGAQRYQEAVAGIPGAGGVIQRHTRGVANALQSRADDIALRGLNPDAVPRGSYNIGRVIQESGEAFVQRFKADSRRLYGELDRLVPGDAPVGVSATLRALEAPMARFEGLEDLGRQLTDPRLGSMAKVLQETVEKGKTLTWAQLSEFRSAIGRRLATPTVLSDIPRADLKRVYAGLSSDMADAARAAGPDAWNAYKQAERYYRTGVAKIDADVEKVLVRLKDSPEKVYDALRRGAESDIRRTKSFMRPDDWNLVQAETVRKLGAARPGYQNAAGDVFSPSTFLTEYNKLSPGAKKALFGGTKRHRDLLPDLEKLARIVGQEKDIARMANHSGTAGTLMAIGHLTGVGGLAGAGLAGIPGAFSGAASAYVAPYAAAKLLTNERFTRWLIEANKFSPRSGGFANHVGRLVAGDWGDDDTQETVYRLASELYRGLEP